MFVPPGLKIRAGPSGVHLFSRKTGLNILFDEVRVPAEFWARAPREVSIALTNSCDLTCPYCYAPKYPAALEFDTLCGWLHELDANGCFGVGFGGGEPTLYRGFQEMCRHAAEKTGLAVTFTTHAHHLTEALALGLRKAVHFIRISMDGVGRTYEALRGRSFTALKAHLEIARSLCAFGINFVVNSRTLPDLDLALDVATDAGAREFLLLPEQQVRGAGGIDSETLRALHNWIGAYRGPVPLTISEAGANGLPGCWRIVDEGGLRSFAHVDANGVLKRSSYDLRGEAIGSDGIMHALRELQDESPGGHK